MGSLTPRPLSCARATSRTSPKPGPTYLPILLFTRAQTRVVVKFCEKKKKKKFGQVEFLSVIHTRGSALAALAKMLISILRLASIRVIRSVRVFRDTANDDVAFSTPPYTRRCIHTHTHTSRRGRLSFVHEERYFALNVPPDEEISPGAGGCSKSRRRPVARHTDTRAQGRLSLSLSFRRLEC